jgi:hypothetical protein
MPSPCSSSNSNFAVFRWNGSDWDAVCETCTDGYHPPGSESLPDGTFVGEEQAVPCEPDTAASLSGKKGKGKPHDKKKKDGAR